MLFPACVPEAAAIPSSRPSTGDQVGKKRNPPARGRDGGVNKRRCWIPRKYVFCPWDAKLAVRCD